MSADPLSPEAIAAIDRDDMLGDVLAQPHQIRDALWRVESAGLKRADLAGGLVVAGVGGSAIGAELAIAALDGRATRPIRAVRNYRLDPWIDDGTLVLCASYSGGTEETLACFDDATQRGAPRVVLTTGGELARRAREDGVPVIGVPSGMQPRAAVVYMLVATLECAAACGAAPSLRPELEGAGELLQRLAEEARPDVPDSHAKRLARELHGSIPVLYGAGATIPVAQRWKNQLNENAKLPAFWAALPEADHNEVCGWERASKLGRFHSVFLDDPDADERTRARIDPTARIAAPSARVNPVGDNSVERTLGLVLLGDLVSVYLAVLDGIDPTPIEAIERVKGELGG